MARIKGGTSALVVLLVALSVFAVGLCYAEEPLPPVPADVNVKLSRLYVTPHLSDGKGMMLYFKKNDSPGKSTCTGECIAAWPPFYIENPILGPVLLNKGYKPEDFTTISRADGKKQTAFKGWPLYYFAKDTVQGVAGGDGADDIWVAANPARLPQ